MTGVGVALFQPTFVSDVITHRIALQELPDVLDQGCGSGQPKSVAWFVCVMIIRENVHMQVGCCHNAQMGQIGGCVCGIGCSAINPAVLARSERRLSVYHMRIPFWLNNNFPG